MAGAGCQWAPAPATATPRPAAQQRHFGPLELARSADATRAPVETDQVFTADERPVYVLFRFQGMNIGTPWAQEWYHEGCLLWQAQSRWEWGSAGRSWVFYTPPFGWPVGQHEVRLYVDGNLEQTASFRMD